VISAGPPIAPVLMLTTTGRRSGAPRTTPLLYAQDGEDLVIVGSNWGQQHHPAWSANLLAHPEAEVQVGRHSRQVRGWARRRTRPVCGLGQLPR